MPGKDPSQKIRLMFLPIFVVAGIVLGYALMRAGEELGPLQMIILVLALTAATVFLEVFATWWDNRHQQKGVEQTSLEMVGKKGTVEEECIPEGIVRVGQEIWNAVSVDGECLKPGDRVVVKERQGLKLLVERAS